MTDRRSTEKIIEKTVQDCKKGSNVDPPDARAAHLSAFNLQNSNLNLNNEKSYAALGGKDVSLLLQAQ